MNALNKIIFTAIFLIAIAIGIIPFLQIEIKPVFLLIASNAFIILTTFLLISLLKNQKNKEDNIVSLLVKVFVNPLKYSKIHSDAINNEVEKFAKNLEKQNEYVALILEGKKSNSDFLGEDVFSMNIKKLANHIEILNAESAQLKREIETRMKLVDEMCIVSEVDLKGNITYVNDKHCEVSQ